MSLKWIGMRKSTNNDDEMFVNEEEAKKALKPLKNSPVNLISIFGAARQGKSFLMNLMSGKQDLFKISNLAEPCTQGVDLASHFLPIRTFSGLNGAQAIGDKKTMIGFVDAEGQGDRDITYDSRLVSPILLSSKVVIFNWKDSLQVDRMLNLLGVLARAAQGIESNSESTKVFGHLHIVFRDWNFVNMTPEQVYNDLFSTERGRTQEVAVRNQARRVLVESFESIKIWLFPAPLSNTAGLSSKIQFTQLQPSFRDKVLNFRKFISLQLQEPMRFNNEVITGRKLGYLVPALVKVLNTDDVIMPEPIFKSMIRQEVEAALTEAKEDVHRRMIETLETRFESNTAFTMSGLEKETESEFSKAIESFIPEDMSSVASERLETILDDLIARYERHIRGVLDECSSRARAAIEKNMRTSVESLLPADEKLIQDAVDTVVENAKAHAAHELRGWSIPNDELINLGSMIDDVAAMLQTQYHEKNSTMNKKRLIKEEKERYVGAMKELTTKLDSQVKGRLPLPEVDIDVIFDQQCHKFAETLFSASECGEETISSYRSRLKNDASSVITQLKLVNQTELERLRASEAIAQERRLRNEKEQQERESKQAVEEMKQLITQNQAEQKRQAQQMEEQLKAEREKAFELQKQVERLSVQKDMIAREAKRQKVKRQEYEEAAHEAAAAAEMAALAAKEAARLEEELRKREAERSNSDDNMEVEPQPRSSRGRKRRSDTTETEEKENTATQKAKETAVTPSKRRRTTKATPKRATPTPKKTRGVKKPTSASKMTLAEAKEAAALEMKKRAEERAATFSKKR